MSLRRLATSALRHATRAALAAALVLTPSLAIAAGGETVSLRKVYTGNVRYLATGASFRDEPNAVNDCSFVPSNERTVNVNLPVGANVLDAWLYVAGAADIAGDQGGTVIDIDDQTNLRLNGTLISTTPGPEGRNFVDLTNLGSGDVDFFGFRREVSDIVTGSGSYTLSDIVTHTEADGRTTTGTCLAAFSIIVVYEDPSLSTIRVINLFDGFRDFKNDNFTLVPRNFVVGSGSPTGFMTHMTFEGDESITGTERFELQVGNGPNEVKTNALNPANNQYNSTVTGPEVFDTNTTYGFDLDTYDISSQLATQADAFEAVTGYISGQDLVILMAEMISVDNKALADIEVFLDDIGQFNTNTTNAASYEINVRNNGDGTGSMATGFATGYIHVYDDLPAGISIDSMGDINAPGWDCSATNLGANEVRCRFDLSTLGDGQLDRNELLPTIQITVDIATPASPVTNRAYASLCGAVDTCTNFDEKHTDADQFDPKNFFEDFETLFDVLTKSSTNNNVEAETTSIISGPASDLSTSTKSANDVNGGMVEAGDTIEYTITLDETAGVMATDVSVTDTIDNDLINAAFVSSSCTGASPSLSGGVLTVSGISVPAGGACDIIFQGDIRSTATAGTQITNEADIMNGNGSGGTATAPTLLVSGAAAGSKPLYLDNVGTASRELTRVPPGVDTSTSIPPGASRTFNLDPATAAALDLDSGVIPASIWIEAATAGTYSLTARLRYNNTTVIGTDTIGGVTMTTGVAGAQQFPFQVDLASPVTNPAGQDIDLRITNDGSSPGDAIVHSLLGTIESKVVLNTSTVINVDSITFYSDPARTTPTSTIEAGQTIYIETVVSDPFGAFDISDTRLTLIDPNNTEQISDLSMTEDAGAQTAGTKTFYYAYSIPPASSIAPGTWEAQITADEGSEGNVTHTDINQFTTTAPEVDVQYTVSPISASPGQTLTYTITIDNTGASPTTLDINSVPIPALTENLQVTTLPSGTNNSTASVLDITGINAAPGITTIEFTVDIVSGAGKGDVIDHTITLDNMGTSATDTAPSVLVNPFSAPIGNKYLYADAVGTTQILDRTEPTADTTDVVSSQGSSIVLTLAPVLDGDLTLEDSGAGTDIEASVWISQTSGATAERTIEATLGYTGASSGTIGTHSQTLTLASGSGGAQYIPFEFDLPADLTIAANSSLTLRIRNNSSVAGDTITVHSFEDGTNPSRVAFTAINPLTIADIRVFDNDIDAGGVEIGDAGPGDTVWIVATAEDPFGAPDITGAELTVTDPNTTVTLSGATMNVPSTQPASGAQRNFQLSHTLTSELGDWDIAVTADEGNEGLVSTSDSIQFNVNNLNPDVSNSYKTVVNETGSNNNAGDTLKYTITVSESGGATLTGVQVTDTFSSLVTYVPASLEVCEDTSPPSTCTPLTAGSDFTDDSTGSQLDINSFSVPPNGEVRISFDVTINSGVSPGDVISNDGNISSVDDPSVDVDVRASDIVIYGSSATGTKAVYLQDIDAAGSEILTRSLPAAGSGTDLTLGEGGSVELDLTPALTDAITLTSTTTIPVDVILQRAGTGAFNRDVTVSLGYGPNAGSITPISSQALTLGLDNTIGIESFALPVGSTTSIPAGSILQLTITNASSGFGNQSINVFTENGGDRSRIELEMTPKLDIDSLGFYDDTLANGGGSALTNAEPGDTIYARAIISDPFGEDDIESVDDEPDIALTPPSGGGGNATVTFVSPEYDDGDPGMRSFEWSLALPPEGTGGTERPRGTWSVQVTANEGSEETIGGPTFVSQTVAEGFTTLDDPNLSTSTKTFPAAGDVDPGDTLTYTITLNNTGGMDADNVSFSDTLQSSPVALTYASGSTTCTDEMGNPLPNPSATGSTVTLNNISVNGNDSCTITINVTVGSGSPGDTIDNTATITNPMGPGATATATTILLSESQIPEPGNKQLYLDGLGGSSILTRTQPGTTSATTLDVDESATLTFPAPGTLLGTSLSAGPVTVNLDLEAQGGAGFLEDDRTVIVELFVDPNDGGGFQSIDSQTRTLEVQAGTIETFNLTASSLTLNAGARFRLVITNDTINFGGPQVIVNQAASAPYSEVIVPLLQPIEITDVTFWDVSGDDAGGCTPNCGSQIDPPFVMTGDTIWVRATVSDIFGSNDINTGCDTLTSTTNCPTLTLTDPNGGDQTPGSNAMSFLQDPSSTSRQFEFEITPGSFGDGLEGTWQVEVEASEGVEDIFTDVRTAGFDRFGPPNLTVVKSATGSTSPGSIVTYTNNITNTGQGPALSTTITNTLGPFQALELTESGGNWTAVNTLDSPYTVNTEAFDDGADTFTYDPTTFCGAATPGNSPCYDPAIEAFEIELNENVPVGNNFEQSYRAQIE